jgi:hypothetical protein
VLTEALAVPSVQRRREGNGHANGLDVGDHAH